MSYPVAPVISASIICPARYASGSQSVTLPIIIGPPIGTDTTGQSPEGAPCV